MNSKGDERYYNMMNLQSNQLYIDFMCLSELNNTRYRFVVEGKRNKNNFEKVSAFTRSLYKENNSSWIPITQNDVTKELTGLSYEHFKRTVIIPQGHFMEFLHLAPTERTKMLKEIFNLHAFDLSDKTKDLYILTKEQHAILQGQLLGVGEVSVEVFNLKQKEVAELQKKIYHLQSSLEKVQTEIEVLTRVADDVAELHKTKKNLETLHDKAPYFNQLAIRISNIQYTQKHFEQLFQLHSQKQIEIERISKLIETKKQEQTILKKEFENAKKSFVFSKEHYDKLPEYEQEIKALEQLIHIRIKTNQLTELDLRKTKGTATIHATINEIQVLEKQHVELITLCEKEKEKQFDIQYLTQQKIELEQYQNYVKQIDGIRKERIDNDTNIQICATKILALFIQIGITTDSYQYDYATYCSSLLAELHAQKKEHETIIQNNKTHAELTFLHSQLKPGVPCPLCGSKEHPKTHEPKRATQSIYEHQNALDSLESKILHIQTVLQKLTLLQQQISQIQQLEAKASHKMHELTIARNLAEPDEKPDIIETKIAQYSKSKLEIDRLDKEARAVLELKQKKEKELQTYKDAINKISEKISGIRSEISIHESQCSQQIQSKYAKYNTNQISSCIEERLKQFDDYKLAFIHEQQTFESVQKRVHESEASIETLSTQYNTIVTEIKHIEHEIDINLKKSPFKTREEIIDLLKQIDHLIENTKEFEHYKYCSQTAQETITKLTDKLKNVNFSEEDFIQKKQNLVNIETEYRTKNEIYIQEKQLLEQYAQRIEKQKDILLQIQKISHRLENLKTI